MKPINTQITTYEPDCVPNGELEDRTPSYIACMFVVKDGTGDWVSINEHEYIIRELQTRIVYLENVCDELSSQLTGD